MASPNHRFLFPNRLKPGESAELSGEEAHHLVRVLRIQEGEEVSLVDGVGTLTVARVVEASKKRCRLEALTVTTGGARSRVHLVFGVPKAPALEFIIRRCTELGVATLQPLFTQHAQRPNSWNQERWKKILVEVAKQCEELHFPVLHAPQPLSEWLKARDRERRLVFCHEANRDAALKSETTGDWEILVGSEGGWSAEETAEILKHDALPFGLGKNRLRVETATLISLALIKQRLGEI